MRKNYLHTSILKFLLERHKEELEELETDEETNKPDQDLIDETDKEMAKKKKKEEEDEKTLDDVVKEYIEYYDRQKKNKQV